MSVSNPMERRRLAMELRFAARRLASSAQLLEDMAARHASPAQLSAEYVREDWKAKMQCRWEMGQAERLIREIDLYDEAWCATDRKMRAVLKHRKVSLRSE